MRNIFDTVGAVRVPQAVNLTAWQDMIDALPSGRPGVRLSGLADLTALVDAGSQVHSIVSSYSRRPLRPVRAIYFNKGPDNNWSLGWHQDRTIAVSVKVELPGYNIWTVKQGIPHVEPPMAIIDGMMTVRVHIDPIDSDNAPLRIVPGSHRLGRISDTECGRLADECGQTECYADAGDLWLYRTAIVHASHKSKIARSRRVVQIDYSPDLLPEPLEWFGI